MSTTDSTSIQVFHDDAEQSDGVALIIRDASIVEFEGELVPGAKLTPWQARCLAHALDEVADKIEQKSNPADS